MATNISQDDYHKTGLRLPKDLHARLHEAAAESGRSYNSEIVARLQATFNVKTADNLSLLQVKAKMPDGSESVAMVDTLNEKLRDIAISAFTKALEPISAKAVADLEEKLKRVEVAREYLDRVNSAGPSHFEKTNHHVHTKGDSTATSQVKTPGSQSSNIAEGLGDQAKIAATRKVLRGHKDT